MSEWLIDEQGVETTKEGILLKLPKLKALGIAAGVAVFSFTGTPATAGTVSIPDSAAGVDFDAACLVGNPSAPPATPNNVPSPGTNSACLVGTYDGGTEATDLYDLTMSTAAAGSEVMISAQWNITSALPNAGSTCNPQIGGLGCPDLPDRNFTGVGYKALFQNRARQNNTPTNNVGGGCARNPTGTVFDQHGHWADGYHHFIGFEVVWDGTKWVYSAQIGTYDPSPDGAFFFNELGTASSTDSLGNPVWVDSDPASPRGIAWNANTEIGPSGSLGYNVDVLGSIEWSDATCTSGVFRTVYAVPGDTLDNIKGLSTANSTVTLPATVPLSLVPGESDITSVGGFIFFSDITEGNSIKSGIVGGGDDDHDLGIREGVSYTPGQFGSDTSGDSPACPTPTFGGLLPTNPFLNPNVGCQYDDDNIPVPNAANPLGPWTAINPGERGTFLPEWWDTNYNVT